MLWLYIVGGILLFIIFLLLFSATLVVTANNYEFYVDVKYMFIKFRVYPSADKKPKTKKQKKPKKAEKKDDKPPETQTDNKDDKPKKKRKKQNPFEQLSDILNLLDGVSKYVYRLIKAIRITLNLDMSVGGEDAAVAAINYGKYSGLIWAAIGHAGALMTVNPKSVNINCDFEFDRLLYSVYAKIKLRLITVLVIAIGAGIRILKNYIKKDR